MRFLYPVFLLGFSLLMALPLFGQFPVTIDPNFPIADIDYKIGEDDEIRIEVIVNAIRVVDTDAEVVNDELLVVDQNPQFLLSGDIEWTDNAPDAKVSQIPQRKLQKFGTDRPNVYYYILQDDAGSIIKFDDSKDWERINFQVDYSFNNITGRTPTLHLYPTEDENSVVTNVEAKLTVDNRIILVDNNKAKITIRESNGYPFLIEKGELLIIHQDNTQTSVPFTGEDLGQSGIGVYGVANILLQSNRLVYDQVTKYKISAQGKVIGTDEETVLQQTEVHLYSNLPPQVENRSNNSTIIAKAGEVSITDEDVYIPGNVTEDLGIRFIDTRLNQDVRIETAVKQGGYYDIKIINVDKIADGSVAPFYYTHDSKDISPPITLIKQLPQVLDFSFDGVRDDESIGLKFRVQNIQTSITPQISMKSKDGVELFVGGNAVINTANANTDVYHVSINKGFANAVTFDSIYQDVTFSVILSTKEVFSVEITLFNKEEYDSLMKKLSEETDKRKNNRSGSVIKEIVSKLVAAGTIAGNSTDDPDIQTAISELTTSTNKEKVNNTLSDIGKWALIVGKIVLPVL